MALGISEGVPTDRSGGYCLEVLDTVEYFSVVTHRLWAKPEVDALK